MLYVYHNQEHDVWKFDRLTLYFSSRRNMKSHSVTINSFFPKPLPSLFVILFGIFLLLVIASAYKAGENICWVLFFVWGGGDNHYLRVSSFLSHVFHQCINIHAALSFSPLWFHLLFIAGASSFIFTCRNHLRRINASKNTFSLRVIQYL